jgi:hypothetical protein
MMMYMEENGPSAMQGCKDDEHECELKKKNKYGEHMYKCESKYVACPLLEKCEGVVCDLYDFDFDTAEMEMVKKCATVEYLQPFGGYCPGSLEEYDNGTWMTDLMGDYYTEGSPYYQPYYADAGAMSMGYGGY